MLSGVKFLPRDEINTATSDGSKKESRKTRRKRNRSSKKRNSRYSSSDEEQSEKLKKRSKKKKWYSSDESSASDKSDYNSEKDEKVRTSHKKKTDGDEDSGSRDGVDIVRCEMGLEWMLKPADRAKKNVGPTDELPAGDQPVEEKVNPRELNPYLKDNGCGYPEDADQIKTNNDKFFSSSVVGDGGLSWRLKALKRSQEQAARDGTNLSEVVQERWGSLGHLAVSVASRKAAAPRAHLHAIKSRKMGASDEVKSDSQDQSKGNAEKKVGREYLKDVAVRHPEMRAPKVHGSLSWGRKNGQNMHHRDAELVSKAISGINKFANDGNFMEGLIEKHEKNNIGPSDASSSKSDEIRESKSESLEEKQPLSANQLAAKAIQLRLKGKHEEAEKLLNDAKTAKTVEDKGERLMKLRNEVSTSRYVAQDRKIREMEKEDDSDIHLAQTIMKNKLYSMSTKDDDEYEYDGAPTKKSKRKGTEHLNRSDTNPNVGKRIITQQERCIYCFENPKRPKHLVVAIANFTYLMLPQYQPVTPGHCCIVTLQHEPSTRMVDDNVWEEIRNFKKCLMMMFAKQDKEMVFLETVMGLAQQRRHCFLECIPLPQGIAKEAPMYFKKAIDEAEDEWSQHNAKKLIDTSEKGLRSSIPKNFPYFHVEFGLKKGFVHVIDDETRFKSSLGLNVVRGMLQTQDEDMYRRRKYDSVDVQREAVGAFARDWEPFDWTKQLD